MRNLFFIALGILTLAVLPATSCTGQKEATTPPSSPQAEQSYTRPEPKPPVIKDILGPQAAAISEETLFTCWAIDPDGRKLTYEWSAEEGTVRSESRREAYWKTPDKPGTYSISVKVTNDAGLSDNMTKKFSVEEVPATHKYEDTTIYLKLQMPGTEAVKISTRCPVTTVVEIQCTVEGRDPSQLNFKWDAPIGKLAGNGLEEGKASRIGWLAPGTPGQYTVGVTVTDQAGNTATGEVSLEVFAQ